MNLNSVPTKGNLIAAKNSLKLAKQGYELMDKKRNILIKELMGMIDQAQAIQKEIDVTFSRAYKSLELANIEMGENRIDMIASSAGIEDSLKMKVRSIMGTEIPKVDYDKKDAELSYAFYGTRRSLDVAVAEFLKVKDLTVRLAEIENAAYRLAMNIKKTQKRANALNNITIPVTEEIIKNMTDALEEKEREDFIRLKVIKRELSKEER